NQGVDGWLHQNTRTIQLRPFWVEPVEDLREMLGNVGTIGMSQRDRSSMALDRALGIKPVNEPADLLEYVSLRRDDECMRGGNRCDRKRVGLRLAGCKSCIQGLSEGSGVSVAQVNHFADDAE